jgi:hypothetical protein
MAFSKRNFQNFSRNLWSEEFVVGRDWYFSGSLLALLVLRLVPFG